MWSRRVLNQHILVFLLMFLSLVTRFYQLGAWPEAFAADEAALGYSAWSILTTGRDEWGAWLPLTLRSIDDWKPAIYSWLAIPGVAVFGISEMTARLPSAIFGALLPLFLYWTVSSLTGKKALGLLSGLMVVLSPWHIEVSRTAIEAGVALSLFALSLVFFAQSKEKRHWWGVVLLLLTLFTYHSSRLVAPPIVIAGCLVGALHLSNKIKAAVVGIGVLGIVLSLTASSGRFSQISIFKDRGAELKREEAIREDGGVKRSSLVETRLFHNKPLSYTYSFVDSYLQNTSLSFLFLGGAQPPRVTIPETGQFLLPFLPFLLLGFGVLLKNMKPFDKWLLWWLLISPLPVALTYAELPHQYRTLFMLPPLAIVMAQGVYFSYLWTRKNYPKFVPLFVIGMTFVVTYFFGRALHQYWVHQQVHQPWFRQAGYERLINYLDSLEDVERVIMTNREGEPYMFFLFYKKIPPREYQQWPEKRLAHVDIEAGKSEWQMFEYTFSENPCPFDEADTNSNNIYVSLPTCELPIGYEKLTTINFLDGNPEFLVSRPAIKQVTE